ncbi:MAG: SRPBCC family protein [Geminicoccaceae bacterium]|nr:MAG: SRPBCC family protein [Geminicoccaceae bacterium]
MTVEVERKQTVRATPEEVWAVVGDFGALADWHPAVAVCDVERHGEIVHRHIRTVDGAEMLEREIGDHPDDHSYTYEILSSPLPVRQYRSIFRVVPDDEGAKVIWSSTFEAEGVPLEEAAMAITAIYDAGLRSIAERFA